MVVFVVVEIVMMVMVRRMLVMMVVAVMVGIAVIMVGTTLVCAVSLEFLTIVAFLSTCTGLYFSGQLRGNYRIF